MAETAKDVEILEEDNRATLNLFKGDGSFKTTIKLPPENATKYLTMPDGVKYTRVEGTDNWQAEAPPAAKEEAQAQ